MNDHPVLARVATAGVRLGLTRLRRFLAWMGNPHQRYPVIHVAGTNGKGSVCRIVGAMLEAHGLRVGITTSPHLQDVNERIRIGGRPIEDADLDSLLIRIERAWTAWAAAELPPDEVLPLTWFELSIATAFVHFADRSVDIAVVEVGMGGRLDATNVVDPIVTAIVTIGLDHLDVLGPDHATIAAEKAGIIKHGVPVVVGPLRHDALAVVRAIAAEREAPISLLGHDFDASGSAADFGYRSAGVSREGLLLGLQGDHQVTNAAVALRIVELLPGGLRPSEPAIRAGLRLARNRGRLEWLAEDLLVDGAHNMDGAGVLAGYLAQRPRPVVDGTPRPRVLLLGAGGDKDVRTVILALAPVVDRIVTTQCSHVRARDPVALAEAVRDVVGPAFDVTAGRSIAQTLPEVRAEVKAVGGELVVAGSLYLVGAVRDLVGVK